MHLKRLHEAEEIIKGDKSRHYLILTCTLLKTYKVCVCIVLLTPEKVCVSRLKLKMCQCCSTYLLELVTAKGHQQLLSNANPY